MANIQKESKLGIISDKNIISFNEYYKLPIATIEYELEKAIVAIK